MLVLEKQKYNPFLVWMARAEVYFHKIEDPGHCKEFNYIRRELHMLKPYKPKSKIDTNE